MGRIPHLAKIILEFKRCTVRCLCAKRENKLLALDGKNNQTLTSTTGIPTLWRPINAIKITLQIKYCFRKYLNTPTPVWTID